MEKKVCAASDCNKKFEPKMYKQKYCSYQCKWREYKRIKYKSRAKKGLCPQCGGELDVAISPHKNKVSPSYCSKCQDYYHQRYSKKKEKSESK
ncbi:hypothetical protein JK635_07500 [Neobacillus sp. YIM B02564]|uniref:Uncharacterized protein n=1 Tax=Neobacillus paridis TaxID=2803862 RepID=A0ABS1TM14_9BACI|nr:hypothetical protein [Neobacillus paridis]MBL4952054.1 hypothetical protein [Neobacillus paridis]